MMDFNDLGADGMDERIESFERLLASGESFFYDNDELGLIIDYYIDFEPTRPLHMQRVFTHLKPTTRLKKQKFTWLNAM